MDTKKAIIKMKGIIEVEVMTDTLQNALFSIGSRFKGWQVIETQAEWAQSEDKDIEEQDWTAEHISHDKWYVAYDEAGQVLGWYESNEEAKQALIEYAKTLNRILKGEKEEDMAIAPDQKTQKIIDAVLEEKEPVPVIRVDVVKAQDGIAQIRLVLVVDGILQQVIETVRGQEGSKILLPDVSKLFKRGALVWKPEQE